MPLLADSLHSLCHAFHLEPLSSSDWHPFPRCHLTISFSVFLSLSFLLWVFTLSLSWPIWCYSFSGEMSADCPFLLPHFLDNIFHSCLWSRYFFWILSLFVTLNSDLSMLLWATTSFLSWCFVKVHVSEPYVIASKNHCVHDLPL